jgi:hypothetical protein
LEFPHRYAPHFTGARADHLVVIGDSISAGIFKDEPWPVLFQKYTNIPVANLSAAGAEASDALDQTRKLIGKDTLVLIEIGGNDLIGGVPCVEFEARLDKLLAACVGRERTLIMFELPLLPHRIAYGRIQPSGVQIRRAAYSQAVFYRSTAQRHVGRAAPVAGRRQTHGGFGGCVAGSGVAETGIGQAMSERD